MPPPHDHLLPRPLRKWTWQAQGRHGTRGGSGGHHGKSVRKGLGLFYPNHPSQGDELSHSHISSSYWLKLSHGFGLEWIGWKSWPKKTFCWHCEKAVWRVMAPPDAAKGCWCKTQHQYFKQHYLLIAYLGQKEKVAHHGYEPAGVSLGKRPEKGRPLRRILYPVSPCKNS